MRKLEDVASVKSINPNKPSAENSLFIKSVGEFLLSKEKDESENWIEIVPGKEILVDYLFHILKKPLRTLHKESNKTIKKLSLVALKGIEIPVPTLERQQKLLSSKNVEHRFQKFWLESGVRTYDEPIVLNMSFNEALMMMKLPPKK